MSRLQSIENELEAINETVFQELCDRFLALRNNNYSAFSRTGSQSGKQKTTKGIPDSFFLLPNGNFIYVETTTNVSDDQKLANDIKACFEPTKAKIPSNKIEEIILCFNFNLDQKQLKELNELAITYKKDIHVTFWSLDALAIVLHRHHRDLVHEFLGLAIDTGQIVPIEKFIGEYNRMSQGISTPLDNEFVHRETEKAELKQAISGSDFVILTGPPGVGKTKLAIETILEFYQENSTYNTFCISYKSHTLLDDLFQYLDRDKNYILFVDDVNRIDAFNQILGFYRVTRTGKLKVITTVRDYAFREIDLMCHEYSPIRIDIGKLTDDQITDIIKAKPFEILNYDYQREILRIADGNPRLAIMASLLAKEQQNLYALSDVSNLFEKYFSTFIKDKDEFANNLNIKCLGIIAFFYPIQFKIKELIVPILKDFTISYPKFIDSIDKLDKLELVEIQYDHVKIPEQNLSTFFFYKAFIKENLLSFKILLKRHFDNNADRFLDCVIPANNTFGSQNVMDKLKPELLGYWKTIGNNHDKAYKFLSTFWFYLQTETLEFLYYEIDSLPTREGKIEYQVYYDNNAFSYDRNRTIELLSNFFRFPLNLKDALELSYEYIRKLPKHLPELIHKIRETLIFDREDKRTKFSRQTILFELLIQGLRKGDKLYKKVFFEIAKTFLKFMYHQSKSGRKKSSYYWSNYHLPNTQEIQELRKKIWNVINDFFRENPHNSLELLESYYCDNHDVVKEIMEFDVPFILNIIENNLSSRSFEHCRYVQKQIREFKRNKILNSKLSECSKKYTNQTYEIFLIIDWDKFRDKEMSKFDDYREYERMKVAEIRSTFKFSNQEELKSFLETFSYLKKEAKNAWNYNRTLDHIIDENCSNDFNIGFQLLGSVALNNNEIGYLPGLVFQNHLNTKEKSVKIWELIQNTTFKHKSQWELSFFDYIDESLIHNKHPGAIIKTISEIDESIIIYFGRLKRFLKIDPGLFQNILTVIYERNEQGEIQLHTWMDCFSEHFDNLGDDLELIKKTYIQQNLIQDHSDYGGKGFSKILKKHPNFLISFVRSLYCQNSTRLAGDHRDMSYIWEVENIEEQLIQVFDLVIQKELYFGILEHFCNCFYRNLQDRTKERADKFLLDYVSANYMYSEKMNVIVDIVRHTRKELFESVLLHYISLNQNPEDFLKILWSDSSGTYSIDVIIEDIEAFEWRNILSIVEKSNLGIKLIPIKKSINEQIENHLKSRDWERQRRFLERY